MKRLLLGACCAALLIWWAGAARAEEGVYLRVLARDDSLEAQLNNPAVTVVSRPMIEMGHVAAEMLLNILEGKPEPRNRYMMDVTLVRRESIADLRGENA